MNDLDLYGLIFDTAKEFGVTDGQAEVIAEQLIDEMMMEIEQGIKAEARRLGYF